MEGALTIRIAGRGDVAAIDAMMARAYGPQLAGHYPPSTLVIALPIIARARPELVASGRYFVAENGEGRILGAGGWSAWDPHLGRIRRDAASIRHFATDAAAARRGVGRAIMGSCLAAARAEGFRAIVCVSTLNAVQFYRSMGFEDVQRLDLMLRQVISFPAILMQRRLT